MSTHASERHEQRPHLDLWLVAVVGLVAALVALGSWVLIDRTTWGFAARIAGGNVRAAQVQGLPVGRLIMGETAAVRDDIAAVAEAVHGVSFGAGRTAGAG